MWNWVKFEYRVKGYFDMQGRADRDQTTDLPMSKQTEQFKSH